jgi:hypothetical protein
LPREIGTAVLSALVRQLGVATHLGGLLAVPYFRALYSLAASIQVRLVVFPDCLDTPRYILHFGVTRSVVKSSADALNKLLSLCIQRPTGAEESQALRALMDACLEHIRADEYSNIHQRTHANEVCRLVWIKCPWANIYLWPDRMCASPVVWSIRGQYLKGFG